MREAAAAFLLLFCFLPAWAQPETPPIRNQSAGETVSSDISRAAQDAAEIAIAPLHFTAKEWTMAASVAGGTALLFTFDRTARSIAARNHGAAADAIADVGREYGREIYGLSLAVGLYAGGFALRHDGIRATGRMLFESVAIAGAVNMVLKSIIGRSRPQTGDGPFAFRGLETSLEHTSLPSGHSTVAFAVSSVLSRRIKNPYATAGLYALAGATACSRVYHDNHWFSDTFLGAALGTSVGFAVSREEGVEGGVGILIQPALSGLRVELDF